MSNNTLSMASLKAIPLSSVMTSAIVGSWLSIHSLRISARLYSSRTSSPREFSNTPKSVLLASSMCLLISCEYPSRSKAVKPASVVFCSHWMAKPFMSCISSVILRLLIRLSASAPLLLKIISSTSSHPLCAEAKAAFTSLARLFSRLKNPVVLRAFVGSPCVTASRASATAVLRAFFLPEVLSRAAAAPPALMATISNRTFSASVIPRLGSLAATAKSLRSNNLAGEGSSSVSAASSLSWATSGDKLIMSRAASKTCCVSASNLPTSLPPTLLGAVSFNCFFTADLICLRCSRSTSTAALDCTAAAVFLSCASVLTRDILSVNCFLAATGKGSLLIAFDMSVFCVVKASPAFSPARKAVRVARTASVVIFTPRSCNFLALTLMGFLATFLALISSATA